MTKEEVLDKSITYAFECDDASMVIPYGAAENAMDEYAKQQAIAFGNWMQKCNYAPATEEGKWQNQVAGENDIITTEELHDQFIEQQNKL